MPQAPAAALGPRDAAAGRVLTERLGAVRERRCTPRRPVFGRHGKLQDDPHFRDYVLFYEYFHGDTGEGLGASHQTGWTGLLANLVMRRYQKDITPWSGLDAGEKAAWVDELA